MNFNTVFSQESFQVNLTPGGTLDYVFDHYGNQYTLSDILINNNSDQIIQNKFIDVQCNSGIFRLNFTTGSGMENPTDLIHIARRAVVCQVFQDISDLINSPLKNPGNNNKVEILIRDITSFPNFNSNLGGLATGFYNLPQTNANNQGGIADNEIFKTINAGIDSYMNVTIPISNQSQSSGSSFYYHGVVAINPNINWHTDLTTLAQSNSVDLYSVVLHEVTHALGFASLINENGNSNFGTNFNYFSRYDTFLKNSNNINLISTNNSCQMYNYSFTGNINDLHPNCLNPNIIDDLTDCATAIRFETNTSSIPVYRPACYQDASSLSHFEDYCYPTDYNLANNNQYFTMSNANFPGSNKRFLKPEERETLCNIGYSLNTSYGDILGLTVVNNFIDYGANTCQNVTVSGINDGLNGTLYSFIDNIGNQITITNILSNDYFNGVANNPNLRFESLEDISNTNSIITITGINDANASIIFTSNTPGLHLLRYVPFDVVSQVRGNITYVYVYVLSNCGIPSACNMIINGDFEQNSSEPLSLGQIDFSCNWFNGTIGSSVDFFSNDFGIPCNYLGGQINTQNNTIYPIGNSYIGLRSSNSGSEIVRTRLKQPLEVQTQYEFSIEISHADKLADKNGNLQVLLSNIETFNLNQAIQNGIITNIDLENVNRCEWTTVKLQINTNTISDMQFMYIGNIENNDVTLNTNFICNNLQPTCNLTILNGLPTQTYYYIDNVSLIENQGILDLPEIINCETLLNNDLTTYLQSTPINGVFTGNGIEQSSIDGTYSFNPQLAGNGITTITYTYQNLNGCSLSITATVEVDLIPENPIIFGNINLCTGDIETFTSNIENGTWTSSNTAVAEIDSTTGELIAISEGDTTITYTTTGNCISSTTMLVSVLHHTLPIFSFPTTICNGSTAPVLPLISDNNIQGTWFLALVSNTISGHYTFTPTISCAEPINVNVNVVTGGNLVTNNDNIVLLFSTTAQTSPSIILNDTFNGTTLAPNFLAVPVVFQSQNYGITANLDGTLNIPANLAIGTYTINYNLKKDCLISNISTITLTIIDNNSSIDTPKKMGMELCYSQNTYTTTQSIFSEVYIDNYHANSSLVDIVVTDAPAGFSVNPDGTINIPAGSLPEPQYIITYNLCPSGSNTNCVEGLFLDINISSTIRANTDVFTFQTTGATVPSQSYNVISNDQYSSDCGMSAPNSFGHAVLAPPIQSANVFLSGSIVAGVPWDNHLIINQSTGDISTTATYNNLMQAGSYPFTYTICDIVNPTICSTSTGRITVLGFARMLNSSIENSAVDFNKIKITPNPTKDFVTIDFETKINKEISIELYTILGQKLKEFKVNNLSNFNIDLTEYPTSSYLIKISNELDYISKIILKK